MPKLNLAVMPCTALKGVGKKLASYLQKCGIVTVQDLLFYFPWRYEDRTTVQAIGNLSQGIHAVVEGNIESAQVTKDKRRQLICHLSDGTGNLQLRFIHFYPSQQARLIRGVRLRCFGEVRKKLHHLEIVHPECHFLKIDDQIISADKLTPIYPITEGLRQQSLYNLIEQALQYLEQEQEALVEYLPQAVLTKFNLPEIKSALLSVHRPSSNISIKLLNAGLHPAQRRLAFEELLAHYLSLRRLRKNVQKHAAPILIAKQALTQKFIRQLPFTLTNAQAKVIQEISADLTVNQPMLRLVQGDVGSGKTIVAAMAILQAIENGYQAALMAPTELLVEQHYQNFRLWLEPLAIKVIALSGKYKGKLRKTLLKPVQSGTVQLILGTHALYQRGIEFAKLGLVIIDEQHRFGVEQRLALREKAWHQGYYPHQLIMTATPIPRTLAMTVYADLDTSIIDQLPPDRLPITTVVVSNERRREVIERIRNACHEKRQVYWICTLIAESEFLEYQAVEVTAEQLTQALPELRIGLVHGRLKNEEKLAVMQAFKAGEIDILVATTVIEVGVDVPNASLMIIENPERLGLAQLHQLRGRIGRGNIASYCVLLYQAPLSQYAKARLSVLRNHQDGFIIAQSDLELRGSGEVLGTRQTGLLHFKIADLSRDQDLLLKVQQIADDVLHDENVNSLIQRWLVNNDLYGQV